MKVYEFAKKNGIETLELMDKIRKWKDLKIKSHMATLDSATMDTIQERLKEENKTSKKRKTLKSKKESKVKKVEKEKLKQETSSFGKKIKSKTHKKAGEKISSQSSVKKTSGVGKKVKKIKRAEKESVSVVHFKKQDSKEGVQNQKKKSSSKKERNVIRRAAFHSPKSSHSAKTLKISDDGDDDGDKRSSSLLPSDVSSEEAKLKLKDSLAAESASEKKDSLNVGFSQSKEEASPNQGEGDLKSGSALKERDQKTPFSKSASDVSSVITQSGTPDVKTILPDDVKKEDRKKKFSREGAPIDFSASDFRKREVIFQPKRKKLVSLKDRKKNVITTPSVHKRVIKMYQFIGIKELAMQMNIQLKQLVRKLLKEGVQADVNSELDYETVSLIAQEYGFETQSLHQSVSERLKNASFGDFNAHPIIRTPIVTVMGHVDHGKTTLLDVIRNTNAVKKEFGGITQHIGAYSVSLKDEKRLTFIDTPGHEAFTAMRARGSHLTDIVVLVVAADDGVMPQTIEAIHHAQAAKAPIIVALNKVDLSNANSENIKQQLTKYDLIPEEWGGSTMFCEVSALKKKGIDNLLEQIYLLSEMQDLKANPKRSAVGFILESSRKKGFGNVATVLIKEGTLKNGDVYLAGNKVGRVRNMVNDLGEKITEVDPGLPVEILGVPEKLEAGDPFNVCLNETTAKSIALQIDREKKEKKQKTKVNSTSIADLFSKLGAQGEEQRLSFIIKSDVSGSGEAIEAILSKLSVEGVEIKIIHSGLGAINESDVLLASTTKAFIIGFNVRPDIKAQKLAQMKSIEIKTYNVIYDLVDDVKKLIIGKVKPEIVEESKGRLEVREVFHISKIGVIAGCFVVDGRVARNDNLRLLREGRVIYEGGISSLRRFKEDVKEVKSNFECGVGFEGFNDIKVGDEIETFLNKEVKREDLFSKDGISS